MRATIRDVGLKARSLGLQRTRSRTGEASRSSTMASFFIAAGLIEPSTVSSKRRSARLPLRTAGVCSHLRRDRIQSRDDLARLLAVHSREWMKRVLGRVKHPCPRYVRGLITN